MLKFSFIFMCNFVNLVYCVMTILQILLLLFGPTHIMFFDQLLVHANLSQFFCSLHVITVFRMKYAV